MGDMTQGRRTGAAGAYINAHMGLVSERASVTEC